MAKNGCYSEYLLLSVRKVLSRSWKDHTDPEGGRLLHLSVPQLPDL